MGEVAMLSTVFAAKGFEDDASPFRPTLEPE